MEKLIVILLLTMVVGTTGAMLKDAPKAKQGIERHLKGE